MTQTSSPEVNIDKLFERAWTDEVFKQALLGNPKAVLEQELGAKFRENVELKALEEESNSLYLLIPFMGGESSDFTGADESQQPIDRLIARASQDSNLKQELLDDPREIIARETGIELVEETNVKVLEETEDTAYFLLPQQKDTEELSEQELKSVTGGRRYCWTRTVVVWDRWGNYY